MRCIRLYVAAIAMPDVRVRTAMPTWPAVIMREWQTPPPTFRVIDFDPRWRDDFARLNLEWLRRWFEVEPVDHDRVD